MAKERLSINELEEKKTRLVDEIARLKSFIESSDTSTFEIMIDDIKKTNAQQYCRRRLEINES